MGIIPAGIWGNWSLLIAQTSQPASGFFTWDFWSKPLQGIIQWGGILVLGYVGLKLKPQVAKVIATPKEKRIEWLLKISPIVIDVYTLWMLLYDGWRIHYVASNFSRGVMWFGIFTAGLVRAQQFWMAYRAHRLNEIVKLIDENYKPKDLAEAIMAPMKLQSKVIAMSFGSRPLYWLITSSLYIWIAIFLALVLR